MRKTIYLVDSSPDIGRLYQDALQNDEVALRVFTEPRTALKALARDEQKPSLLITGFAMSSGDGRRMSGIDLAEEVRSVFPDLPIILVSGMPSDQLEQAAGELVNKVLFKPFLIRGLRGIVQELLCNHTVATTA